MAIRGFNESSLSGSEVWNKLNTLNPNETMQQKAVALIKSEGINLTPTDIQASYIAIKQITDSLTVASVRAFENQSVKVIYTDNKSRCVNQAIPFLTFRTGDQYTTYIFANTNYVTQKEGAYMMQAPILRDLLTGATVANGIRTNYSTMVANQYLQETLMKIYCAFISRILNREFSIMTEKAMFDKIQFWICKFFLLHVFGSNDTAENIDTLSSTNVRFLDSIGIEEAKSAYNETNPTTIGELINMFRDRVPRMKSLNLGIFLSDWINYYHEQSMLAVDNIEYLVFMVICLLSGNNIINIAASDIVKETKKIAQFRGELLKLL